MIHFALNSQDVCVFMCVWIIACMSVSVCVCEGVPECRLFEFVFAHPIKGNKRIRVQQNVFLDNPGLQ